MSELKPCPLCGGEVKLIINEWLDYKNYRVRCKCGLIATFGQGGWTKDDTINAWNTRYEPTCTMDEGSWGPDGVYAASDYICSNCERVVWINGELNYCPNCGAKVVDE